GQIASPSTREDSRSPLTDPTPSPTPPPGMAPNPPGTPPPRRPGLFFASTLIFGSALVVALFVFLVFSAGPRGIAYNQFRDLVERGQIAKLTVIGSTKVVGEVRDPDDPTVKDLELNKGKFSAVLPKIDDVDKFLQEVINK